MKKFNIKTIFCIICLLLALLLYNMVLTDFVNDKTLKDYYQNLLTNYNQAFESSIVKFVPYTSAYEGDYESDAEYINSLRDELAPYQYNGYIEPSSKYIATIDGNQFSCYVLGENYAESQGLSIDRADNSFVYSPAIDEIGIYLSSSLKDTYKTGDEITANIEIKDSNEKYTVAAKVAGYVEIDRFDAVNQIITDVYCAYLPDIQPLFDQDITYRSTDRMFSLTFTNLDGNMAEIAAVLQGKGAIVDYDYTYSLKTKIKSYNESLPFYIIFIITLAVAVCFAAAVNISNISSIYKTYKADNNTKKFNKKICLSLIYLAACFIIYLAINVVVMGFIACIALSILPYLIILALISYTLVYNKKRIAKND